jgi:hypothetical protein
MNVMNEENKFWTKCQFECVQTFSEYTQSIISFRIIFNIIDILSTSFDCKW